MVRYSTSSSETGSAGLTMPRVTDLSAAQRIFLAIEWGGEALAEKDVDLPSFDGYVTLGRLGRGGGGDVFQVTRSGSDRPLALKLLHAGPADPMAGRRAWRELDLLADVRSPHVPRLHDYGVHDGRVYFATDFVDGVPLTDYCDRHQLGRRERVELLARVAEAVQQALHERGIIHRDLKPSNILVDGRGDPVIIDLGVAQLLSDDSSLPSMTMTGQIIGTPMFMAPEQATGKRQAISTRTDVFSLGATAFRVLTGELPHDRDVPFPELVRRVTEEVIPDIRRFDTGAPAPLAAVIAKATALDPAARYGTAGEFAADLRRWLKGEPVLATPQTAWTRLAALCRRHKAATSAIAASLALLFITTGALGYGVVQSTIAAERQRQLGAMKTELADVEAQVGAKHDELARMQELLALKQKELDALAAEAKRALNYKARLTKLTDDTVPEMREALKEGDLARAMSLATGLSPFLLEGAVSDAELVAQFDMARLEIAETILTVMYHGHDVTTVLESLRGLESAVGEPIEPP